MDSIYDFEGGEKREEGEDLIVDLGQVILQDEDDLKLNTANANADMHELVKFSEEEDDLDLVFEEEYHYDCRGRGDEEEDQRRKGKEVADALLFSAPLAFLED
jgi:hypothetical protein